MVDGQYRAARYRVDLLTDTLNQQKSDSNDLAEKLVQYNILVHEAESNKQLYDGLLQKLKEASISAGLRSSNIRIVDPALAPAYPSRPQKGRNILMAFLVGLVGGVGLAFFREYLDNTVKSPDDIENLAGLPSLAVVPAMPSMNGHHKNNTAACEASRPTTERMRASSWCLITSRNRRFPKLSVRYALRYCSLRPIIRPKSYW